MATPTLLQDRFDLGFKRDISRDQLPKGACYDCLNFLPGLGVPLRKRGGWAYEGSALTTISPSAGFPMRVAVAPFTAGTQVLAVDDALSHLFDITNSADRGAVTTPGGSMVFYRNRLYIPSNNGAVPKHYDGTTIANTGGGPPGGVYLAVYRDHLVSANDLSTYNRVWFSAPGNGESWDTSNSYIDTSEPVYGLAALPSALLVFHNSSVEVIRGSAPPSATGIGDMSLAPLFSDVGIFEPMSFTVMEDKVVFADEDGIYLTDGAAFTDLTKEGQIKDYWRTQVAAAGSGATLALGSWKGYVLVSLLTSAKAYVDFLLCDTAKRAFFRCDNIFAKNFASRYGASDRLYFSNQESLQKRVGEFSTIFAPNSGSTSDGNGNIIPILETAFFANGKGKSRFRRAYVGYSIFDTGGPTLDISYGTTPEATSYLAAGSLPKSAYTRKRVPVSFSASGLSFKATLSAGAGDLRLYSIEAESIPKEGSRL